MMQRIISRDGQLYETRVKMRREPSYHQQQQQDGCDSFTSTTTSTTMMIDTVSIENKVITKTSSSPVVQSASYKHRLWLDRFVNKMKHETILRQSQFERQEKLRNKMARIINKKAAARRRTFDAPTKNSVNNNSINANSHRHQKCSLLSNYKESKEEEESEYQQRRIQSMIETRRKHKQKYKQYLLNLQMKASEKNKYNERMIKETEERRQKLRNTILMKCRKYKKMEEKDKSNTCICNDICENNDEEQFTYRVNVQDRSKEDIEKIVRKRAEEAREVEKRRLQLERRTRLLKNKYNNLDTNNKSASQNMMDFDQSEGEKKNKVLSCHADGSCANLPTGTNSLSYERLKAFQSGKGVDKKSFDEWKRISGLPKDQLVFCISGWYPSIRDELKRRGWYHNQESGSKYFDLKWSLHSSDLNFNELQSWQRVNHFQNNRHLTTKTGLMRTLQNLSFHVNRDVGSFFPRAYDLSRPDEIHSFLDDFRLSKIVSILQKLLLKRKYGPVMINTQVLNMLVQVLQRQVDLKSNSRLDWGGCDEGIVTEEEIEVIMNSDTWLYRVVDGAFDPENINEAVDAFLKRHDNNSKEIDLKSKIRNRKRTRMRMVLREELSGLISRNLQDFSSDNAFSVESTLNSYMKLRNPNQQSLNGKSGNNMWIVKPGEKSRGRGIMTFTDLEGILKYTSVRVAGKHEHWFVQKYMENALLIAKRKFDIRQWVLVSSYNPLVVWFYDECYVRFAVDEYSRPQTGEFHKDWLEDKFRHLVNNSISKESAKFHETFTAENGIEVRNHMWHIGDLESWILSQTGNNLWKDPILQQIKAIVNDTLVCGSGLVTHRERTWELFGFDFMLDDKYNPWLIEINSSPACDYSTDVTEKFVPKALTDLLKVVLDYARDETSSIGGWEKIYDGPMVSMPASLGVDLTLNGSKLLKPKLLRNNGVALFDSTLKKWADVEYEVKPSSSGSQYEVRKMSKPAAIELNNDFLEFDDSDLSDFEENTKNGPKNMNSQPVDSQTKRCVEGKDCVTKYAYQNGRGKENTLNHHIISSSEIRKCNSNMKRNSLRKLHSSLKKVASDAQAPRKVLLNVPVKTVLWDLP